MGFQLPLSAATKLMETKAHVEMENASIEVE
jgi:hypothetical protein